jgi:hypothetical protein
VPGGPRRQIPGRVGGGGRGSAVWTQASTCW